MHRFVSRFFLLPIAYCLMPSSLRLAARASSLIRTARIAHLATADAKGRPHVVPICFVFDGKLFYSPIDEKPKRTVPLKLKRSRNIRENPQVSLVIDRYDENWSKLGYVLVFGKARILSSGKKHQDAIRQLRRKYRQYRRMGLESRPMIAVSAAKIVIWGTI